MAVLVGGDMPDRCCCAELSGQCREIEIVPRPGASRQLLAWFMKLSSVGLGAAAGSGYSVFVSVRLLFWQAALWRCR